MYFVCFCTESTVEKLEETEPQTEVLYRFDGMNLYVFGDSIRAYL